MIIWCLTSTTKSKSHFIYKEIGRLKGKGIYFVNTNCKIAGVVA